LGEGHGDAGEYLSESWDQFWDDGMFGCFCYFEFNKFGEWFVRLGLIIAGLDVVVSAHGGRGSLSGADASRE
jgi:hypothetical protein